MISSSEGVSWTILTHISLILSSVYYTYLLVHYVLGGWAMLCHGESIEVRGWHVGVGSLLVCAVLVSGNELRWSGLAARISMG